MVKFPFETPRERGEIYGAPSASSRNDGEISGAGGGFTAAQAESENSLYFLF